MRVLLADDDKEQNKFACAFLKREGYFADSAFNGEDALELASGTAYDAILLDVMMPKMDGLDVLKALRKQGNTSAILMVTSHGDEKNKLSGFQHGADDYIVKPFLVSEFIARVRAVTRRTCYAPETLAHATTLTVGDLRMDLLKHEVSRKKKIIDLRKKEYELLEYLMRNHTRVLSQEVLAQQIWGIDFESHSNLVEVHIKNLRAKLNTGFSGDLIETIRGFGYALRA